MKKTIKSITLLTALVFLGCAETNSPKPIKTSVEHVYDANHVPRVIVPPSMRHRENNAWSKIAHALKLDDKAKRSFGGLNSLFKEISVKIIANNYSEEQIYELIKGNNGKAKKTSNSQRPYQFYYTQKLDEGILFVLFSSRSNVGSIHLNPTIKKVGRTELYKKAYHIDFDITGHTELNRGTSSTTIFSTNSKSYSNKSDRMSNGGANYSPTVYRVYAIVGMKDLMNFSSTSTDKSIREQCKNVKTKQLCYDRLVNEGKK